jgi:hypothetical protein
MVVEAPVGATTITCLHGCRLMWIGRVGGRVNTTRHAGLGLTSVAATVHALKGRLHVASRSPRLGTSVHVVLPIFSRRLR